MTCECSDNSAKVQHRLQADLLISYTGLMSTKERFLQLQSLHRSGRHAEAADGLAAALRLSPKEPNLLHLAALVAEAQQELPRAVMLFQRALTAHPDWLEAEYNLARVLTIKGDLPDALTHWQRALKQQPQQAEWRSMYLLNRRNICDWNGDVANIEGLPPQATIVLSDDAAIQKQSAEQYARVKFGKIQPLPPPNWQAHDRLRIGYISADFHAHATAYLMAELFSLHDKAKFEVFCYSYGVDDGSDIRMRLRIEAEHFAELNKLTAAEAAMHIREDEIDILIDLKGYTRGSRPEILAYRPAKMQMHWLGYPGTTGAPFIDYFVGDNITLPEGSERFFTETLLRLPNSYQINDRQRAIAPAPSRATYGLPGTGLVLASFNQNYKITPELFIIWCEILRDMPKAVLWLYQSNQFAPDNLRRAAKTHGIDPARLIFAESLPLDQHLARYAHVDLALDTFPVGGHTTTSDALWAGVPVVTMMGQSFVSRAAASVLTAAGLPQLVTITPATYKELVLELARDEAARSDLKKHLTANRLTLPLFDTPGFVKKLEDKLKACFHETVYTDG